MKPSSSHISELKHILEHSLTPDYLDDHPWARSLVVRQGVEDDASLREKSPGYRLVKSLSALFRQMMPSTPPNRGKRLDTRWCQVDNRTGRLCYLLGNLDDTLGIEHVLNMRTLA